MVPIQQPVMESIYWKRVVRWFCFCFFFVAQVVFFCHQRLWCWATPLKINICPEKWWLVQMIHVLLKSMMHPIEPLFLHSGMIYVCFIPEIIQIDDFLGYLLLGTCGFIFWGGPGYQSSLFVRFQRHHSDNDFRWPMSTSWQAKRRAVRVAPLSSAHGPRTPGGSVGPPGWHRFDKVTTKKHQGCRVRYNVDVWVQKSGVYIQLRERLLKSHDLQGFIHPNGGCLGFLNHQHYVSLSSFFFGGGGCFKHHWQQWL